MKKIFITILPILLFVTFSKNACSTGGSVDKIAGSIMASAINHAFGSDPTIIDESPSGWGKFEARRGGSFGGGRSGGGFGRSRSSGNSFGSRRSSGSSPRSFSRSAPRRDPLRTPSFGGRRLSSSDARTKYGAPRRVESFKGLNESGTAMNYRVNNYGGFTSGLMMGYLTGRMTSPWMYGARFFYSRPVYVENADGTVDVYPPTFDIGKVFFSLIIIIAIIVFVRRAMLGSNKKINRSRYGSQSSFG